MDGSHLGPEGDGGGSGGGGGSGTVTSVAATDASIVVTGTPTVAPTLATGTLDAIATLHPPTAAVNLNGQKLTNQANGTAASDSAAFGQIPTVMLNQFTVATINSGTTAATVGTYYRVTGTCTLTLGTPTTGQWILYKLINSATTLTLTGTVDGQVNPTVTTQYQAGWLVYNGSTWDNI